VTRLAQRLASGLDQLGFPAAGGGSGDGLAGIISIGRHGAGGHDSSDDSHTQRLAEALKRSGVRLSVRQGMVRLSFHIYNDDADVDRVLEVAGACSDLPRLARLPEHRAGRRQYVRKVSS
jgi:cysteine desulfurase / selenocysteine lyase